MYKDGNVVFGDNFSIAWSVLISLNSSDYTSIKELAGDIYGDDSIVNYRRLFAIIRKLRNSGWSLDIVKLHDLPCGNGDYYSGVKLSTGHYYLLRDFYESHLKNKGLAWGDKYNSPDLITAIIEGDLVVD